MTYSGGFWGCETDDEYTSLNECLDREGGYQRPAVKFGWFRERLNWQWATPSTLSEIFRKRRLP